MGEGGGVFESIRVKSKVFLMFEKGKDPIDVVIEKDLQDRYRKESMGGG